MNLKNKILFIIGIELTMCFSANAQRGGFIGRSHQVDIDLFEMTQQNRYSAGYKFSWREHFGILGRLSFQNINKRDMEDYRNIGKDSDGMDIWEYVKYGSYSVSSFEVGGGFLFNSANTGFALPLGNYIGTMLLWHSSRHNEIIDSLNFNGNYKNSGKSIRMIFGRNIYIAKNVVLDVGFTWGFSWGKILEGDQVRPPRYVFPNTNFWTGVDEVTLRNHSYFRFYLIPNLRIGYLF